MGRKEAAQKRANIFKMHMQGISRRKISDELGIDYGTVGRVICQFRQAPEASTVINIGNRNYPYELKQKAIDMHLVEGIPLASVAAKLGITSFVSVKTWCWQAKKNGGALPLPKSRGRKKVKDESVDPKSTDIKLRDDELLQLKRRNEQLEMENDLLKKLHRGSRGRCVIKQNIE